jgi:hypothetical protein
MEQARRQAASTLQSLIFLGRGEEKRLRAVLADGPKFLVKMRTRAELEKILQKIKLQSVELARLGNEDG